MCVWLKLNKYIFKTWLNTTNVNEKKDQIYNSVKKKSKINFLPFEAIWKKITSNVKLRDSFVNEISVKISRGLSPNEYHRVQRSLRQDFRYV